MEESGIKFTIKNILQRLIQRESKTEFRFLHSSFPPPTHYWSG